MESSITPSHLQPSFVANGVSFGNTQYHYKNVMDNTWFKPLIVRAANKEWSNITEDDKRHCYNLIGEFVATWLGQMNREISKDPELEFNGPSLSTTLTYRNIIDEIADLFFEFPWEKADGKEPVDGDKHRSSTVFTPETLSNVFFNIITVPNKDVVNSCKMYGALRGATHSTSQNSSVVANQLKNYVSKTMRGDPDSTFWAEYSSEKIPIVPRQMLDAIKDDSREMRTMKSLMEHMRDGSDQSDMKTPLLTKFIQIHAPTKAPFAQNLLMRPFSGTYEDNNVEQICNLLAPLRELLYGKYAHDCVVTKKPKSKSSHKKKVKLPHVPKYECNEATSSTIWHYLVKPVFGMVMPWFTRPTTEVRTSISKCIYSQLVLSSHGLDKRGHEFIQNVVPFFMWMITFFRNHCKEASNLGFQINVCMAEGRKPMINGARAYEEEDSDDDDDQDDEKEKERFETIRSNIQPENSSWSGLTDDFIDNYFDGNKMFKHGYNKSLEDGLHIMDHMSLSRGLLMKLICQGKKKTSLEEGEGEEEGEEYFGRSINRSRHGFGRNEEPGDATYTMKQLVRHWSRLLDDDDCNNGIMLNGDGVNVPVAYPFYVHKHPNKADSWVLTYHPSMTNGIACQTKKIWEFYHKIIQDKNNHCCSNLTSHNILREAGQASSASEGKLSSRPDDAYNTNIYGLSSFTD